MRELTLEKGLCAACAAWVLACAPAEPPMVPASYDDLVTFFREWREFERPVFTDGVPDYTAPAMERQYAQLAEYAARLAAMDTSGWSAAERVEYELVRAELNGLDFDHRVRRPWALNPAFYTMIFTAQSDVPAHEGPIIHGWIDLWQYDYPLSAADAAELASRIDAIPALLEQARGNLVGNGHDLWRGGIRAMAGQSRDLGAFAQRARGTSPELDAAIQRATEATDAFRAWLEDELPGRTGPSGVGKDNYTWYMQNVHLVPYGWDEQLTLLRRELVRAHTALRLEENRNRGLPELERVATPEEYDRGHRAAVATFLEFLDREEIVSVTDYMALALLAKIGAFTPTDGLRGFFAEVDYRDPLGMRVHGYHWIELARLVEEPHPSPIRSALPLYNIYDARSEGLATGLEEWAMHAGLWDDHPRGRELVHILLAQRAARGIGALMQHANEWTLDEAAEFASEWVPRGWLPADGSTIIGEQHLYLQQPGYGTSYVTGKIQLEQLLAERAIQLGDQFTIQRFFDEFLDAGVIPIELVRWELTGKRPWHE